MGGVEQTGPQAAPCNISQKKLIMGSHMPLEVHLAGVKMVGVRSAHPHHHLNPYLCASFLLQPLTQLDPRYPQSTVVMCHGGGPRLRMWLRVPNQTMHTGVNGVVVVDTA